MTDVVRVERLGNIHVWTVDRPAARNAISQEVARALDLAVAEVENDRQARAVVLTGSGTAAFISGADLKFLQTAEPSVRIAHDAHVTEVMMRIERLPLPVIGALNGPVIGGGMEVALACDLRIAEPHVTLTFKHAAMGITPGWGGYRRLAAAVGRSTAARLLFTALPLSAEVALRVGLLDEVVSAGKSRERALELAEAVAQTSPSAIREIKRLLHVAYEGALTLEEEQRTFVESTDSHDHREALSALTEKRTPRFEPR